jgi:hypothetical protein
MGFPPQQTGPLPWHPSSPYNDPLLFVIPSEAEGSAVLRTFLEMFSVITQSNHRMNARSPSRRYISCKQRNRQEQQDHT